MQPERHSSCHLEVEPLHYTGGPWPTEAFSKQFFHLLQLAAAVPWVVQLSKSLHEPTCNVLDSPSSQTGTQQVRWTKQLLIQAAAMDLLGVGSRDNSPRFNTLPQEKAVLTALKHFENGKPLQPLSDAPKHSPTFYALNWVAFEHHMATSGGQMTSNSVPDTAIDMQALSHKRTMNDISEGENGRILKHRLGPEAVKSSGAQCQDRLRPQHSRHLQSLSAAVNSEGQSGVPVDMLNVTTSGRIRSQHPDTGEAAENDARASRNNISDANLASALDAHLRSSALHEGLNDPNRAMPQFDSAATLQMPGDKFPAQAPHQQPPFQASHQHIPHGHMQPQQKFDTPMSASTRMLDQAAMQHMFHDQNTLDGPAQPSGDFSRQAAHVRTNTADYMATSEIMSLDGRARSTAPTHPAAGPQPQQQSDPAASAAAASVAAAMATVVDAGAAQPATVSSHGGSAQPGAVRRGSVVVDAASAPAAARLRPEVRVVRRSVYDSTVPSREELDQMTFMQKVQSVYHRPISEAAQVLDMGVTVLKKQCRNQNISRWPFRKLQSIDKLIQSVQMVLDSGPEEGAEEEHLAVMDTHARLVVMRHRIFENPQEDLDEWAKKLRQANFKQQYKRRQETNPFEHLPFNPTPEQQDKLLQDIEARRRQHAPSELRQAAPGTWDGGTGGAHAAPAPQASLHGATATRHGQADAETTCSSEEEEEEWGDGRSRSRGGRDGGGGARRPSRRSQRPRRFADTEMFDDEDPDYEPQEAGGPQMRPGPPLPDTSLRGAAAPFSVPANRDVASDRDMMMKHPVFRSGGGGSASGVLGDLPMSDAFLPQVMPGFAYPGGGMHGGMPQRGLPGLVPQQQVDFGDGRVPAQFMQHDAVRPDWGPRPEPQRRSAQARMHLPNPYGPGVGFEPLPPQRSSSQAGPISDSMSVAGLISNSMFPSQARSAPAQHVASMPAMTRRNPQYCGGGPPFPHDLPQRQLSHRSEPHQRDTSMSAGLDALLHATALPTPFTSGQLSTGRPGDFSFPGEPCQGGGHGRRLSGQGHRAGGGGIGGIGSDAGGGAVEYAASRTILPDFPSHQQQRGHPMGIHNSGLRATTPQEHHADRAGMQEMRLRRMQSLQEHFQHIHGADDWSGMGGGM
eukprot:jgi/Ulvmu1/10729/UM068_0017.1